MRSLMYDRETGEILRSTTEDPNIVWPRTGDESWGVIVDSLENNDDAPSKIVADGVLRLLTSQEAVDQAEKRTREKKARSLQYAGLDIGGGEKLVFGLQQQIKLLEIINDVLLGDTNKLPQRVHKMDGSVYVINDVTDVTRLATLYKSRREEIDRLSRG